MHIESHLACGWILANLLPGSTRRERLAITLSAVISDADGLGYLVSADLYSRWHHTIGHNVFAAVAVGIVAIWLTRLHCWPIILLLTQLGYWSHIVGDYFFSGWGVPIFWPVSRYEILFHPVMRLDHPINMALSYGALAIFAGSIWVLGRSPLEFLWPKFDGLLARLVAPRRCVCHFCGRRTGIICDRCHQPVCVRHGQTNRKLQITCRACEAAATAYLQ